MFEKEQTAAERSFENPVDFLSNYCDKNLEALLAQEPMLERTSTLKEHRQIINEKLTNEISA